MWLLALVAIPLVLWFLLSVQVAVSMLGPLRWLLGGLLVAMVLWKARLWSVARAHSHDSADE
jgi:hypothetical protein